MSQTTEFDIERVSPHVDLVLFDNVISCYPCDRDITANYTLGEHVSPSTWDWVGIFRCDWRYLGEYMSYRWAPAGPSDSLAPRRRGLNFPSNYHQMEADSDQTYQFLYVSHGNHVVGVSPSFRVDLPEHVFCFNIATLFREVIPQSSSENLLASFEVVDETRAATPKCVSRKRKITNVYKDSCTLVDLPGPNWPAKLGIVEPIVREYLHNNERALVQYSERALVQYSGTPFRIYDVTQRNVPTTTAPIPATAVIRPLIEEIYETPTPTHARHMETACYPILLPGTHTALHLVPRAPRATCTGCQIVKALLCDAVGKMDQKDNRIHDLETQLEGMQITQEAAVGGSMDREHTVGILDWCLQQIQTDNSALRTRVDELEQSLAAATHKHRLMAARSSTPSNHGKHDVDSEGWILKEPKKIVRLKKTVGKQSRSIYVLKQAVENKTMQVNNLKDGATKMRRQIQNEKAGATAMGRMVSHLNTRIKTMLAARAKDHTNEWRQLARQVHENTTQTVAMEPSKEDQPSTSNNKQPKLAGRSHVKNKQISKLLKSEKPQRSKLHKERSQAEQCPTCGLRFSVKADWRVIEEHIVFHDKNRSHK